MKAIISLVLRYIPRPYLQLIGHWVARFLSIFYIGNKVECPVCESRYRKFLPYGRNTSSRENALVPKLPLARTPPFNGSLPEKENQFLHSES
jgi:hypothetical protein